MNAIEIMNLSKRFKGRKGFIVEALKGVSIEIRQGEVFGFLGPNGAGKTTTIKILMGLIKPTSGGARLMGQDITSHLSRRNVGYLPENPAFYDYLQADEYLLFVGRAFDMRRGHLSEKIEESLKLLDLWDARERRIRDYSKGMVQRLGLAQVLLHDPDVYILDEPMSGLDPVGRALVKKIIIDLKAKGKCVFFSTHIISDVETVCDRVGIIIDGVLQSIEDVGKILTEGVNGYHLSLRDDTGKSREIYVAKDEVFKKLSELRASGIEISLIEPTRKGLEDFFLDIVKGKNAA